MPAAVNSSAIVAAMLNNVDRKIDNGCKLVAMTSWTYACSSKQQCDSSVLVGAVLSNVELKVDSGCKIVAVTSWTYACSSKTAAR